MTASSPTRRGLVLGAAALALPSFAAARPGSLTLTLLGQSLLEHDLRQQVWPDRPVLTRLLGQADAVFTNLETVIQGPEVGAPTRALETLHAGEPVVIDCLKSLGVSLVSTANNHAFDLGAGGVRSTLAALKARSLPFAGAGETLAQAAAPGHQSTAHGRVALVAFATGKIREGGAATATRPGVNEVREVSPGVLDEADLARVFDALRAAARQGAVVIAYQHDHLWGDDMTVTPAWKKVLARRCVEAGASVFVSHGAPVLHGIEWWRGAPLFYGLGNFIFQTETPPGRYPSGAWDGLVAECRFEAGRCREARLTPLVLNETGLGGPQDFATRGRPSLASPADARRILEGVAARSAPIVIANGVGRLTPP